MKVFAEVTKQDVILGNYLLRSRHHEHQILDSLARPHSTRYPPHVNDRSLLELGGSGLEGYGPTHFTSEFIYGNDLA